MPGEDTRGPSAILTIPNLVSGLRIALIPVFVALILDRDTSFSGLLLFAGVLATDWVDGALARATGRVSELGRVLDPVADRLAIGAGLIALTVRGAFPLAAALPILVRDAAILLAGLAVLRGGGRIQVRPIGRVATFALMTSIACIAWGTLGFALHAAFLAMGWTFYGVGLAEYAVATVLYVADLRRFRAEAP